MRIATYNIRNVVALDRKSWWFRRRSTLAAVVRGIEVDVWAMQEAYRRQVDFLNRQALPGWRVVGTGRNAGGGGEACPIWVRPDRSVHESHTLWFGESPNEPGSRLTGASAPRLVTIAVVDGLDGRVVVANTHLDEKSPTRREASMTQLVGWLADRWPDLPHVILGDLNDTLDSPALSTLSRAGYRSALTEADGPTSNGFGNEEHAKQLDHIFVSAGFDFGEVSVRRDAGLASDHWPVIAEVHAEK